MNLAQITTNAQPRDYMTTPTPGVIDCVKNIPGDLLILGGSGKMGPELTEMIVRADAIAGTSRKITVASTFSNPRERTAELFAELGVTVMKGERIVEVPGVYRARTFEEGKKIGYRDFVTAVFTLLRLRFRE